MRYTLQTVVMIGDIILFLAVAWVLVYSQFNPFCVLIAAAAMKAWYDTGVFDSWRPSQIKKFMKNAKRYGL
jgi:hypothetical protein